jgi:uncharacterized PurR-regulated membrane protein YhhQ (DUF165 family)
MAAFAVILICSNLIGAGKVATLNLPVVGAVTFGAGILFFPLSYVLGDVLTEVYGYARARRVVWVGFAASVFAAAVAGGWLVARSDVANARAATAAIKILRILGS